MSRKFFIIFILLFSHFFFAPQALNQVSANHCTDPKPNSAPILTSAVAGEDSVTLTWIEAQDPVTYYLVAYGRSETDIEYGNPNIGPRGTTTYAVGGLVKGVKYYFRVRAVNNCKPGKFSNKLSAIPGFRESVANIPNLSIYKSVQRSSISATPTIKAGVDISVPLVIATRESSKCLICVSWQLLIVEAILLITYLYISGRFTFLKQIFSMVIPIVVYILFWKINGQCFNAVVFYSLQHLDRYTFLVPLGVIGIWRWSVWMMKEIVGLHYRPKTREYNAKVSIVTPVYNENPQVFTQALDSWKKNNPSEIIAVIDYTDLTCIEIFKKFKKTFSGAVLIITDMPGKRQALADGIKVVRSEIVALVDSDTIWSDDVLRNGLSPFHVKRVAGVATYQSVLHPKTFAQKIFDIQLDLRYRHEYPFLAAAGNALVCLSGRTAFYRREVILPMVDDLVNEKFLGRPVISGDDKRLTYLVLAAGWKVAYQSTSHVYTPGMSSLSAYLKHRLCWTRNSLRADLSAILSGWPARHPALLFFQIDKILQSFVVIISPIFFFVSIYLHLWMAVLVIPCWWFISRTVKLYYPHLSHKPENIIILPGYVLYSFLAGLLKIYALFTLNTQGWITRWDKSRLPQFRYLSAAPAYVATVGVVLLLTYGVYIFKERVYLIPKTQREQLLTNALRHIQADAAASGGAVLGESTSVQKELLTSRYEADGTETFADISNKLGVNADQLYYANSAKTPNRNITRGTVLSIPGKDVQLHPEASLIKPTSSANLLTVKYDNSTNTLLVTGKGRQITLK